MARFLSKHGAPLHIHAILGCACLMHFLYRYVLLAAHGTAFERQGSHLRGRDTALVLLHALLHLTSFRFDLPARRNFTKPMIWPEFRMHSAVFAMRHVACTLAHWWLPEWWIAGGWNVVFVVAASECAGCITRWFGDATGTHRTTNAMPYPEGTSITNIASTKSYYVAAQVGATTCAVWGPPTLAFLPLCAIELAPFMMTLVRKGKASALTYHRVYALAIFSNYPAWAWVILWHGGNLKWLLAYIVTQAVLPYIRFSLLGTYRAAWSWLLAVFVAVGVRWLLLQSFSVWLAGVPHTLALPAPLTNMPEHLWMVGILVSSGVIAIQRVAQMFWHGMGWMVM
jgi:hypothetical protein